MKKNLIYFVLLFIVFCSCNNQNDEPNVKPDTKVASSAYLVTEDQAIDEAVAFLKAQGNTIPNKRQARAKRKVEAASTTNSATKQEGVYIVNFDNNSGYAVVSADKRDGASVYIASSEGNFDENNSESQELLSLVRDYQNTKISSSSYNPDKGDGETTETTIVEENYGPLLNTCWNQKGVFNVELKRIFGENVDSAMGCVPVAIGQIINYYQYPDTIRGEFIDWNLISLATGREYFSTSATNAASRLLYLIGTGLGINYPSESGANYDEAQSEFRRLGYVYKTRDDFDEMIVKNQIAAGNPLFMCGFNDSKNGHAWVVDGFMKIKTEYRTFDNEGNLVENTILNEYNYDYTYDYIHMNPGWGENYLTNKLSSIEYESSIGHKYWAYSEIFNFVPGNSNFSYNNKIKLIYNFNHK